MNVVPLLDYVALPIIAKHEPPRFQLFVSISKSLILLRELLKVSCHFVTWTLS